jgi:serine/threonine protein kinase
MGNDFQKEVNEIFANLIGQLPDLQKTYLDEICRDKPEVRKEVEKLLATNHDQSIVKPDSVFSVNVPPTNKNLDVTELHFASFSTSLIGTILENRYLITEKIGEGGMGFVFKAEDKKLTNRAVVVKFLKPEMINQEYLLTKFRHEMESLARVKGEGVIDIYDIGSLNEIPYIVTEFFDGVSLDKIMKPKGLPFREVAEIIKKIGKALTEVHQTGIIHRDLKPSNIMIKYSSNEIIIKIIDFGVARVQDSVISPLTTQFGKVLGTVYYVSPEQFLGTDNLTSTTDIYSLGIISYELLTGKRPFEPTNIFQLTEMHRQGVAINPQILRPEISDETQFKLLKALSYDPQIRYQSAADFGNQLSDSLLRLENVNGANVIGNHLKTSNVKTKSNTNDLENGSKTQSKFNSKWFWGLGLSALVLLAVSGFSAIFLLTKFYGKTQVILPTQVNTNSDIPLTTANMREFKYSLLVQPTEKNREPFLASPMQTFLNGWRFRFQFNSSKNGYLYLLNENLDKQGSPSLTILFPDSRLNDGKAQILANQPFTTNQYEFANKPGVEKFWIIWASEAVSELEAVKNLVNPQDLGMIRDVAKSAAVEDFLQRNKDKKVSVKESGDKQNVTVESDNNVIVTSSELRHN